MRIPYRSLATLLAVWIASPVASAATITVTLLSDGAVVPGECTLREAITAANTNVAVNGCAAGEAGADQIVFEPSLGGGTIEMFFSSYAVTEELSIDGATEAADGSATSVTIDGVGSLRVFEPSAVTLSLSNLRLRNGAAPSGAGVLVPSGATLRLDAVRFADFVATGAAATDGGAAVYVDGGTLSATDALFSNNRATGAAGSGGAVFNNGGTVTLAGGAFVQNRASRAGGGIEAAGASTTTLDGVVFQSNNAGTSPGNGGAFHITGPGDATITDGRVESNIAGREGGGFWNGSGQMRITRTVFEGNEARGSAADDGGGALFNNGGRMVTQDVVVQNNRAPRGSGSGGGVMTVGGTLTMSNGSVSGNTANRAGAGIESAGATATIVDVMVTGNVIPADRAAPGNGGGIHAGGGELIVEGGTYEGNEATEGGAIWANGTLAIGPSLISGTVIRGNTGRGDAADNGGGGVYVESGGNAALTAVVIEGNAATGASGSGGGLLVASDATATVTRGRFTANTANRAGAGIEVAGGTFTIEFALVDGNTIPEATAAPGNGGGLHAGGGTVVIRSTTFRANEATEGGGVWTSGALTMVRGSQNTDRNIFDANVGRGDDADNGGGAIFLQAGTATIAAVVAEGNAATGAAGSGGGLFVNADATATVSSSVFRSNTANRAGGGIEVAGGTLTLAGVTLDANTIPEATAAPGNGGGLHAGGGSVTVRGGRITNNAATEGGGLWSNGTLVVERDDADEPTQIMGNVGRGDDAANGGGGVYAESGAEVTISGALIDNNRASGASGSGGGVFAADGTTVSITGAMISNNAANRAGAGIEIADDATNDLPTALRITETTVNANGILTAAPGNGGGVHIGGAGQFRADRSTISNNSAREGAGVWSAGAGQVRLSNSTVSRNAAAEDGGGVYDNGGSSSADIALESVTVAFNTAGGDGGGLLSQSADGASFTFANTVVGRNAATGDGDDCSGAFDSGDYNLVQRTSGCTLGGDLGNTITGQDPMLGALADNGGPTRTHLPMDGSPVINVGLSQLDVDQRGLGRGNLDDIGSVEFGSGTVSTEPPTPGEAPTAFALLPARPNPAHGRATVAFTVADAADARVELYNALGQRVAVLFDGAAAPGRELTADLDASALAPGVYVVRLTSGAERATQRLTVVR